MTTLQPPKPFKTYTELVALMRQRGMQIDDLARAERKLMQIGYYRLSGYWYVCREQWQHQRTNQFCRVPTLMPCFSCISWISNYAN